MFTSATAETSYPTGKPLGTKTGAKTIPVAGDIIGAADTRTTAVASSVFALSATEIHAAAAARVRCIDILVVGTVSPTIKLQDQLSLKDITPTFTTAALGRIEFGPDGILIQGGFSVVTAGTVAAVCAITYDLITPR